MLTDREPVPWQPHDADAAAEAHLKRVITVAFAKFDVNGDGILDVSEIGKALTELTTGKVRTPGPTLVQAFTTHARLPRPLRRAGRPRSRVE